MHQVLLLLSLNFNLSQISAFLGNSFCLTGIGSSIKDPLLIVDIAIRIHQVFFILFLNSDLPQHNVAIHVHALVAV
ncbi:hypothetical protein FGO68_gene1494 [Halteria grandinella]|uniref:Secreted protein n=1 Tax=Halteria grandinella TaxID=5974 RepID=A0A8J8SYE5_HALGN|nr:hypothetical protein FGO68_gene1494 [Halteria grandinella]